MPGASLAGAIAGEGARSLGASPLVATGASIIGGGLYGVAKAGYEAVKGARFLKDLADEFGTATTKEQVGKTGKAEAESWMNDESNPRSMPARQTEGYAAFDNEAPARFAASPTGDQVTPSNLEGTLKDILKIGHPNPVETDLAAFHSPAAKQLWNTLTGKGPAAKPPAANIPTPPRIRPTTEPTANIPTPPRITPAGQPEARIPGGLRPMESGEPGAAPGPAPRPMESGEPRSAPAPTPRPMAAPEADSINPLSWDAMIKERTRIGQGMNDDVLRKIGQTNLDRIYAAMTKDLQAKADEIGLRAEFEHGNEVTEELKNLAKNYIGKIAKAPDAEGAYKEIIKDSGVGGTRFGVFNQELPDLANELASMHIRQIADNPEVWTRLSPGAKQQLVRDPQKLEQVDAAVASQLATGNADSRNVKSILGAEIGSHIGRATLGRVFNNPDLGAAIGSTVGGYGPRAIALGARESGALRYPVVGGLSGPRRRNELTPSQ
jgi:hypothetical protein